MSENMIGAYFKRLRENARLSQSQLAENGDFHQSVISRLERGEIRIPTDDTLRGYSKGLGMPLEDLRRDLEPLLRDNSALDLGFLHGVASSPLILVIMAGELEGIRAASVRSSTGPVWVDPGEKLDESKFAELYNGKLMSAGALREYAGTGQLDMIVASSEMFGLELTRHWMRCACISTSYEPLKMMEFQPIKDGEDQKERPRELPWDPASPIRLFYPEGTIGQRYMDRLRNSELRKAINPIPFQVTETDEMRVPEPVKRALQGEEPFRVISWHPLSSYMRAAAMEVASWNLLKERNVIEVLNDHDLTLPRYSVDLLLNLQSPKVTRFIRSKEYRTFFTKLELHSRELSPENLNPNSTQVKEVCKYLGDDKENEAIFRDLRVSTFQLMLYPDFLYYLEDEKLL